MPGRYEERSNPYTCGTPHVGVKFTQQGSSKDQARFQQRSSKDDFSKNHGFDTNLTPIYGGALFDNAR